MNINKADLFDKIKYNPCGNSGLYLRGDSWDRVAYNPEHRLVVSVVLGKRTVKNIEKLVLDF